MISDLETPGAISVRYQKIRLIQQDTGGKKAFEYLLFYTLETIVAIHDNVYWKQIMKLTNSHQYFQGPPQNNLFHRFYQSNSDII